MQTLKNTLRTLSNSPYIAETFANNVTIPSVGDLLRYDTNHRSFHEDLIAYDNDEIIINNIKRIKVYAEKDPANLPWGELDIDLVLECTGLFTNLEDAHKHIAAGAKKVVISAPAKGDIKTVKSY